MTILIIGLILFIAAHVLPMLALRQSLAARFGEGAVKGLVTLVSLAGLVLIIWGYGEARSAGALELWTPPRAMKHLTMTLMLPVFILLVAAYVPSWIRGRLKHPMLAAVKLWALAHLLSNGSLPDVLLFGSFLAWAVAARISLKRRGNNGPGPTPFGTGDWIAIGLGLALYGLIVWRGHLYLIGVSPMG